MAMCGAWKRNLTYQKEAVGPIKQGHHEGWQENGLQDKSYHDVSLHVLIDVIRRRSEGHSDLHGNLVLSRYHLVPTCLSVRWNSQSG